jgi:hypothetical protein
MMTIWKTSMLPTTRERHVNRGPFHGVEQKESDCRWNPWRSWKVVAWKGVVSLVIMALTSSFLHARDSAGHRETVEFVANYRGTETPRERLVVDISNNDPALRGLRNADCRYFLAESAIRGAGLGVFTATDLARKADAQPVPDLCFELPNDRALTDFSSLLSDPIKGIDVLWPFGTIHTSRLGKPSLSTCTLLRMQIASMGEWCAKDSHLYLTQSMAVGLRHPSGNCLQIEIDRIRCPLAFFCQQLRITK